MAGPALSAAVAVAAATVLRGPGGGPSGTRAAQGTLRCPRYGDGTPDLPGTDTDTRLDLLGTTLVHRTGVRVPPALGWTGASAPPRSLRHPRVS